MFKRGVKREVEKFLKLKIRPDLSDNKIIGIQEIKDHLLNKSPHWKPIHPTKL